MKAKIPYDRAVGIAWEMLNLLLPTCDDIEVAGSIRRMRSEIGDIEIVAVPKGGLPGKTSMPNLLGDMDSQSLLSNVLTGMIGSKILLPPKKDGSRYKQFDIYNEDLHLDLFLTTKAQWPVILAIRTGPAEFSKKLVTQRYKGGYLPDGERVSDGFVWRGNEVVPFDSEKNFIEYVCGRWIIPEDRV